MTDLLERARSKSPYLAGSSAERLIDELADEVERLNIRIRQDAEAALQHLNEIDELTGSKAALQEEIERLRELHDELYEESQHRLEMLQRQKTEIARLQNHNEWLIVKLKELRAEIELVSK